MDNILVLGSGRSGTTWVQDCIANANGLSTAFEPLHPEISMVASKYAYLKLEEGEFAPDLVDYLTKEPVGLREAAWINYRVNLNHLYVPRSEILRPQAYRRLFRRYRNLMQSYRNLKGSQGRPAKVIKMIRAHFMVAWLKKNISSKIIFVIRNPLQVISSQYARGDSWLPDNRMNLISRNSCLFSKYENLLNFYNRPGTTKVEKLTVIWAIENSSAISSCIENGIPFFSYEQLRNGDECVWERLCEALGAMEIPPRKMRIVPSTMALPLNYQPMLSQDHEHKIRLVLDMVGSPVQEYLLPINRID